MTLNEVMKETADAIREKKGTTDKIAPINFAEEIKGISAGGSGESGGSNIEYLDVRNSELRDALIAFCYLIKTDGFNIKRPDGGTLNAGRGIVPAGNMIQAIINISHEGYSIVAGSIKAVAIDFNTEVVMQDNMVTIKAIFTEAEELLNAIPRLTKAEFYNLE